MCKAKTQIPYLKRSGGCMSIGCKDCVLYGMASLSCQSILKAATIRLKFMTHFVDKFSARGGFFVGWTGVAIGGAASGI